MGIELGRISGPLLAENLRRNEDLAFETNLLYLDITNGRIGINTDSPSRDLTVNGLMSTTNFVVDTHLETPNFYLSTNRIQNLVSAITIEPNQTTDPIVKGVRFDTDNFKFTTNTIENVTDASNINFSPNGTGQVVFTTTKVNVDGDLHATGDITFDGTITFGNADTDTVTFSADIASNIVPDATETYDLGTSLKRWNTLYTENALAASATITGNLIVDNINLTTLINKTLYVSINGNDGNIGSHDHATYRTLKYALSQAVSGDEVVIFPGTYEEIFPLTVPQGVSVRGTSIRAVNIRPTAETNTENAFLLNGETTVSFLSVKDFYTGYAFNFAPGASITTRSPYITNVSVITSESTVISYTENYSLIAGDWTDGFFYAQPGFNQIVLTTDLALESFYTALELTSTGTVFEIVYNDNTTEILTQTGSSSYFGTVLNVPVTGFSISAIKLIKSISWGQVITPQGDAGAGALVDGSVVDSNSQEASMLFHAATFIVPNANGITATNGARVEWLNSFTYFADKGIYLLEGTAGFAGEATRFGAEFRSINSANVYGNYGAVADGANTLGYLVGHNFGYVGSGLDSSNDRSLAIQANEVLESNDGTIYYDSMDHKGDYRVGDVFYVSQETGRVTFDAQSINFGAAGNITLEGPTSSTIINALQVQTGNIRIYGNNIDSLNGPVNLLAYSGTTTLNTNVAITGNLDITGDVSLGGNLFLGDNPLDTVTVFPKISQDLNPATNNDYTLGINDVDPAVWRTIFLSTALNLDDIIEVSSNTITTLTTDTDLELIAAGTGSVSIISSNVEITNDLTVNSPLINSNFTNVDITGLLSLTGSNLYSLTGDSDRTGNTDITGYLKVLGANTVQFEDINIIGNTISTSLLDSDLTFNSTTITNIVKSLASDMEITNNLDVGLYGYFSQVNVTTNTLATNLTAADVYITGNTITTNDTDINLELSANGLGILHVINSDVEIANNLILNSDITVTGNTSLKFVEITGNVIQTGNINQTGNTYIEGTFANNNITIVAPSYLTVPNFKFEDNIIQVTALDTDLIINSTDGGVVFNRILKITDSTIANIFDASGGATDSQLSIVFSPSGTGDMRVSSTNALAIAHGNDTVRILSSAGEIRQNSTTGLYEGYSPSGLVSFNNIYDSDRNTYVTAELTPGANDNTLRFGINDVVRATISSTMLFTSNLNVDNVSITGTTISNLISANDLELTPNGTGAVSINDILFTSNAITPTLDDPFLLQGTGTGYYKFTGSGGVVIPSGNDTTERAFTPEIGTVRYNTTDGYTEVFNGTIWVPASGAEAAASLDDITTETNLWAYILG